MGSVVRIVGRIAIVLLFVNFVFELLLVARITPAPLVLSAIAVLLAMPWIGRRLGRWPLLGWGWARGALIATLLAIAAVWLDAGNRIDVVRSATVFRGATIITGEPGAAVIPNGVVVVDASGRITSVGPAGAVPIPDGHDVVDLAGRFLMPGLINAHGHLLLNGRVPGEPHAPPNLLSSPLLRKAVFAFFRTYPGRRVVLRMMERNAERALRSGVTTLRGMGDPEFVDVALRRRIDQGRVLGPRLRVSGPLLVITGGHAHEIGLVADGPIEARRAVRYALSHEVDHIKISSTGGVSDSRRLGEAGELQMTPDEIAAITDEAHRKKLLVAAHAESAQGVKEALRAGVDNIEHGAELDAESIRLFKNNPRSLRGYTTLHPTLSVIAGDRKLTEEMAQDPALYIRFLNGEEIKEAMITGFRQALAGGVRIGVGTDAGLVDHGSVWKEMQYFVEVGGISRELALHLGTLGTAESIGLEGITGSVAPGKFADLLVVDKDPRRDLSTLARPRLVVTAGLIIQESR